MTTPLQELWFLWLVKYSEMCDCAEIDAKKLAAPFFSNAPEQGRSPVIMYVGKATARGWYKDQFAECMGLSREDRVAERHKRTKEWVDALSSGEQHKSGFWIFATKLNNIAAMTPETCSSLSHIVWSNVAKIGRIDGNPRGIYFEKQKELAVRTLKAEIETYQPALVHFASWDDCDTAVIDALVDDGGERSWDKTGNSKGIWRRPSYASLPPLVWTEHPQGKDRDKWSLWLNKVREMLTSGANA